MVLNFYCGTAGAAGISPGFAVLERPLQPRLSRVWPRTMPDLSSGPWPSIDSRNTAFPGASFCPGGPGQNSSPCLQPRRGFYLAGWRGGARKPCPTGAG